MKWQPLVIKRRKCRGRALRVYFENIRGDAVELHKLLTVGVIDRLLVEHWNEAPSA